MALRNMDIVALAVAVVGIMGAADGHGMSAYSRKYVVECSKCHDNVPKLNAYGKNFLANDFELPGTKKAANNGDAAGRRPAEQEAKIPEHEAVGRGKVELKSSPRADGTVATQGDATEDSDDQSQTLADSPKLKTRVYKSVSKDGTVRYGDQPQMKAFNRPSEQPALKKQRANAVKSGKSAKATIAKSEIRNATLAVGARSEAQTAPTQRYSSYAECMQEKLDYDLPPESADETMRRVMEAEAACRTEVMQ